MGLVPFWGLNALGQSCNEEPDYFSDPWDTFFINTDQLPGLCWVEGKTIAKIDIVAKKPTEADGARLTILGYDPGEFDIVCRIVTASQWKIFQTVRNRYWAGPKKNAKPPAFTVRAQHPDLNSLNVYLAVIFGWSIGTPSSEVEGAKEFRIHFHEYVAPKSRKPKSAGGSKPPEDERGPPTKELNAPAPPPSSVAANNGLDGPPPPFASPGAQ